MISATVILTCYNRKMYTERCIETLQDSGISMHFIVVNDGSTDGTAAKLKELQKKYSVDVIEGNGQLFWSGGMHRGIQAAKEREVKTDYYLLVNDDVCFYPRTVLNAANNSKKHDNSVCVGVTENNLGEITYGGIRYGKRNIQYRLTGLDERCDSFNCNFVLIPRKIFEGVDNFDRHYTHSMADFDYGLQIKRKGFQSYTSEKCIGVCEKNQKKGTWHDNSLSRRKRIQLKESPKGLPWKEWFYFLYKNFGAGTAVIRSLTPYFRILMKK